MFRSIRIAIANRLVQDDAICYFLGFMIGIGGFAEMTLVGMVFYILMVFTRPNPIHNPLAWSKDIGVVAIGLLLLGYWSYVDPHTLTTGHLHMCPVNGNEALTLTEMMKILCVTCFGISCNHSQLKKNRNLICGVAIGLSIYVIPTILGSIALQGIRGGGNKIFDIFSGNISAQSTTAGYIVIMMIGILEALKRRRLLRLSIGLALITGIQTSNRSVLLFGFLSGIIECVLWLKSRITSETYYVHSVKRKKLVFLFGALFMAAGLSLISSYPFIYSRIRFALDGRLGLYLEGYSRLSDYLLNPVNNLLEEAGSHYWWHSVPLDATRAGNLSGAYLSLAWLALLIVGLIMSLKKRQSGLCLLGLALLFIYMTGMPLSAGGYEFVALYCGYLLLSNELLTNTQA